jgi:SAM-dependent methyltransferase
VRKGALTWPAPRHIRYAVTHVPAPTSPLVFDTALAATRLARATQAGYETFLLARACEDLGERLATITRQFTLAVDLGTPAPLAARVLNESGRIASVTRMVPPGAVAEQGEAVASLEALPLAEGSAELIISLLALQGVNDLPGALVQIRRALKPDGLMLACLFGGSTLTELRQCLLETEVALSGGASPRVAPFVDLRDMGGLLQRAGFALPVADVETVTVRYDDIFALLRDLRAMGLTSSLLDRSRKPLSKRFWLEAARLYATRFADPDGRIRASFDMVWVSGWAPHDSQQKPLKPGSAKVRLAQALGVAETSAGEKP